MIKTNLRGQPGGRRGSEAQKWLILELRAHSKEAYGSARKLNGPLVAQVLFNR